MVLICSGRGSCLSAEISLFNVLHSRAVASALVVVAQNLLTATSRYILLPRRSSTSTPPPKMTVYPGMTNGEGPSVLFVDCNAR